MSASALLLKLHEHWWQLAI